PGCAGSFKRPFHQPHSAANRPNREVAPELNAVTDTIRLARVEQLPTNSLGAHPSDRIEGIADQDGRQLRIAAPLSQSSQVCEIALFAIRRQIYHRRLFVGQVGQEVAQLSQPMVGSAESAGGEIAVSARALGRRLLHNQYSLGVLSGGVRGAES